MPSKSHRRKGKYSVQKKKQGGVARPKAVARQPAVSQAREAALPSSAATRSRSVSSRPSRAAASLVKPAQGRDRYVTAELRNIGILAGVMLVILVVLAMVIS
jgi:hypothetical protein